MENNKLIYASAAMKAILKADPKLTYCIDAVPAIDPVHAAGACYCGECKHWVKCQSSLIGEVMCCTGQGSVYIQKGAADFCSYGERREGE